MIHSFNIDFCLPLGRQCHPPPQQAYPRRIKHGKQKVAGKNSKVREVKCSFIFRHTAMYRGINQIILNYMMQTGDEAPLDPQSAALATAVTRTGRAVGPRLGSLRALKGRNDVDGKEYMEPKTE